MSRISARWFWGSNPVCTENVFLLRNVQTVSGANPFFLFSGYRCSFPGVEPQGWQFDPSLPFGAHVMNEWSCTSTPAVFRHCIGRGNVYASWFQVFRLDFCSPVLGLSSAVTGASAVLRLAVKCKRVVLYLALRLRITQIGFTD